MYRSAPLLHKGEKLFCRSTREPLSCPPALRGVSRHWYAECGASPAGHILPDGHSIVNAVQLTNHCLYSTHKVQNSENLAKSATFFAFDIFRLTNLQLRSIIKSKKFEEAYIMPLLPGTPGERISDLCNGRHISQKELAKRIGLSAPQLSRIVSGETKTLSSDILIAVAKEFKVSTDYILGLSEVSTRKSYDIFELGFSEGAAKGLVTGAVDMEILNRMLEHKQFPKLTNLIRIYFKDTAARGIMARNQIIDMATASLSDFVKDHPDKRAEVREDLQFMSAQKLGEHEAEIEKIKSIFLSILRDIKKDIDSGKQPEKTASAAMIQAIQDEIRERDPKTLTKDDVTEIVVNQLGLVAPMSEKTTSLFRKLLKGMMK